MSDPLSVTASVIAVPQLGCAVAKGLYQIADEIGMAGLEVRLHAQEVDGFSKLLMRMQHTIDDLDWRTRRHEAAEIESHIGEVLTICQKTLQPMKDEIDHSLQPLLVRFRDSPIKLIQVALRIRWCFVSKGKIMFWRQFLQAQHRLLDTTLLQAIYVSNSATRSMKTNSVLRDSLENSCKSLNNPAVQFGPVRGKLLLEPSPGSNSGAMFSSEIGTSQEGREANWSTSLGACHALGDDMPLVLRNAAPPLPEPDLFNMTDEEIRAIKAATRIEMDGPTGKNMTLILLETDAAEKRTLKMVTTTLHPDKRRLNGETGVARESTNSSPWNSCGTDQIGGWSAYRKWVLHVPKMQFRVHFQVPFIFLHSLGKRPGSLVRPVEGAAIIFVTGTDESAVAARIASKQGRSGKVQLIKAAGSQRASWYILLQGLHKMERITRSWEEKELKNENSACSTRSGSKHQSFLAKSRPNTIALQPQKRSWDSMPAGFTTPYATTTFRSVIEMTAMLGLNWKAFDQAGSIYSAEGNGYSLSGRREPSLGILFEVGITGSNHFQHRRLIPTDDIRAMACGYMKFFTTLAPGRAQMCERMDGSTGMIHVGRTSSVADFLTRLGCETRLLSAISGHDDRQSHLFPVVFEIIGMFAKISYIEHSYLRRVPNPTTFIWNRDQFSIPMLILEFQRSLEINQGISASSHIFALREWAERVCLVIRDMIEPGQQAGLQRAPISLATLSVLVRAIEKCDRYFWAEPQNLIARFHFNEVLRFLGESANLTAGDTNWRPDVTNYARLMLAGPEDKEAVLMDVYFLVILPRVAEAFDRESIGASSSTDGVMPAHAVDGWCTLVFRMLCWLLLHDFDKEDFQIADLSGIFGDETPVYIR